jgi:cytochrome c-type biogenesis protein CcmH
MGFCLKLRWRWIVILIVVAASLPVITYAQGGTVTPRPVSDNEVNRVARNLYCPVCQNVPLEVCETEACARWREQIRDLLSQGYTDEQVRQYFIERFGAKTVGTPTDTGSQLLTIALPFALIGLIGVVIAFNLVRWRRTHSSERIEPQSVDTEGGSAPPDDYRARLEAEIRKRD